MNISGRKFIFLLATIIFSVCTSSMANNFTIKQAIQESAMPSNEVRSIYFDKKGLLWIATNSGLCSFNGYKVQKYRTSAFSPNMLPNNTVLCIAEDNNNNLWIGTQNGLACMNMRTGLFKCYHLPKADQRVIYTIFASREGIVYAGTDGGLSRYVPAMDKCVTYDATNTIFADVNGKRSKATAYSVKSLVQDRSGDIIFGTWNSGLFRFKQGSNVFRRYNKINSKNSAHSLYIDHNKRLWIGTWDCGLQCMDNPSNIKNPGLHTYLNSKNQTSLLDNIVYSITSDTKTNTLWIGTRSGLSVMELSHPEKGFTNYFYSSASHPLPCNEINSVTTNGEGLMWFGSLTGGVLQTDTRTSLFNSVNLNSFNTFARTRALRCIYTDDGRHFWLGVGAYGVAYYDRQTETSLFCEQIPQIAAIKGLDAHISIDAVASRNANELWFGTYGNGIAICKKKGAGFHIKKANARYIVDDCITSLFMAHNGVMMIGQRSGLSLYYPDNRGINVVMKDSKSNFSDCNVLGIIEDSKHRFWLATENEGIICIEGDINNIKSLRFHHYYPGNKKTDITDFINCFEDSRHIQWAISNSGGLFRYDKHSDKFIAVNRIYHIPDDQVRSINEDAWGNLWLGTNSSLVKLSFDKSKESPEVMSFTSNDGLNSESFVTNATFRYGKELYFGNFQGMVSFIPSHKFGYIHNKEPRVIISDIMIDNTSFAELDSSLKAKISSETPAYTKSITIPASVGSFGIEFSLLSYTSSEQCKYSYKLEGYDKAWTYCDAYSRIAKYGNPKAGTYTFLVRATDNDGVWYQLPYKIIVHVEPPFYATWWAYLIYIILVLGIIYYSVQMYHRRLKTRNGLQMAVVFTNITHELLTPLTVISASIDHLKSQAPQYTEDYGIMQKNIKRNVRLLQQILEVRKSQAGELKILVSQGDISAFVKGVCESTKPLMLKNNLKYIIECTPDSLMAGFDPDKLDKIIYNLLSNAAKYSSDGGEVKLSLISDAERKNVTIQVSDTGCGISKEKMEHLFERFLDGDYRRFRTIGTGIGLSLTRDLVNLIGGTITCQSVETVGTTFTVILPISKEHFRPEQIDEKNKIEIALPEDIIKDIPAETDIAKETSPIPSGEEDVYNILLVEDNEELLSLMKRMLTPKYNVFTACNGQEALDIVTKQGLDIIVSDVMMPVMDGIELTRTLKADAEYNYLPIILLTAKSRKEDRTEAYKIGADEFIPKPFNLSDLQLRIDNLIENRRRIKKDFKQQFVLKIKDQHYSNTDADFIQRAIDCINNHLEDSEYDREQFASDMGASMSTLYNKLRSLTGMNTSAFVRNIRLKAACRIAKENPSIRVSDLAYRVGFKAPKYFSTCFKKEFGMLLNDYLKQN